MYGFLNLFLAAAFAHEGLAIAEIEEILEERSASAFGFLVIPSRKALSNLELIRPARGPEIWCDMPPVPNTTTRMSSG